MQRRKVNVFIVIGEVEGAQNLLLIPEALVACSGVYGSETTIQYCNLQAFAGVAQSVELIELYHLHLIGGIAVLRFRVFCLSEGSGLK